MLPHLLLRLQDLTHNNFFFLRYEISKVFDLPLGLLGHPAVYNCPLLRSDPMRSKYMFLRYRTVQVARLIVFRAKCLCGGILRAWCQEVVIYGTGPVRYTVTLRYGTPVRYRTVRYPNNTH